MPVLARVAYIIPQIELTVCHVCTCSLLSVPSKAAGQPRRKGRGVILLYHKTLLLWSYDVVRCGGKVLPGCCGKIQSPNDLLRFTSKRSMPLGAIG